MARALVAMMILACGQSDPTTAPVETAIAAPGDLFLPDRPIAREIGPSQAHRFHVHLAATEVLVGAVEQHGADVVVTTFDSAGKKLIETDSPNGTEGPEPFELQASRSGDYGIEVRFGDPTAPRGRYELHAKVMTADARAEQRAKTMLHSPRLQRLWREIHDRRPGAEAAFWREMTAKAPLVEPLEGSSDVLITFVYRLVDPKLYVTVYGGPTAREKPLARLDGTDVLYLTARMPADARFSYNFVAKPYPLDFQDDYLAPDIRVALRAGIADPLNPHGDGGRSIVELPGAPAQPWITARAGVPAGAITTLTMASAKLGEQRRIGVYTPAGFDPTRTYPLLVVLDGEWYGLDQPLIPTPRILDNLIAAHEIPPVVAALVANQGTRNRDLTGSQPFSDFLADELVPKLRHDVHAGITPATTVIVGASYGGVCGVFTALHHSSVFGNVLSQSGMFHFFVGGEKSPATYATDRTWLMHEYAAAPKLPIRFYLEVGRFETDSVFFDLLGANRHMRDVLLAKGYPLTYSEFDGGHDTEVWRGTLSNGLVALLGAPAH